MILIISEKFDSTTDTVIDWLNHYGYSVTRINNHDKVFVQKIEITNSKTNYYLRLVTETGQTNVLNTDEIESIWYRRGDFSIPVNISGNHEYATQLFQGIKAHLKDGNEVIKSFLHKLFLEKQIGNYYDNSTNKLLNLELANNIGFRIPSSIVTTEKSILVDFMNEHVQIITKGLYTNGFELPNELSCSSLTQEITIEHISRVSNVFAPSLFQQYIPKEIELRVFYLNGKCFTVAMLTQMNPETSVDFRNYNNSQPTRIIPFVLPEKISSMINLFMTKLKMRSGSLDIIVDKKGEYYFLEVNPVGQFGFISHWSNVIIEKEIALELIQLSYGKA